MNKERDNGKWVMCVCVCLNISNGTIPRTLHKIDIHTHTHTHEYGIDEMARELSGPTAAAAAASISNVCFDDDDDDAYDGYQHKTSRFILFLFHYFLFNSFYSTISVFFSGPSYWTQSINNQTIVIHKGCGP